MRAAGAMSRAFRRGEGSIIGGRVALVIAPHLARSLAVAKDVVLVSGTNGKTTTTRLITEALGGADRVATSGAGSNMLAGIVTALGRRRGYTRAVLEVDEGYLPQMISELAPRVIVLLNLSRDQLDRVGEVRMIAQRWKAALQKTNATVVANADDPLVVFAVLEAQSVQWVGMGMTWRDDAYHCPRCDGRIEYQAGGWSSSCGFARPPVTAEVADDMLTLSDGSRYPIETRLPGAFNRANVAIAAIAAKILGVSPDVAIRAMSEVLEVSGRYQKIRVDSREVRLLLAKNPSGWTSMIDLVNEDDAEIVIAINSRIADGFDPSWLFDVPFERLRGKSVIACGERRLDLAVRLRHAGVEHRVGLTTAAGSIHLALGTSVDVIANYTAFQDLRRDLAKPSEGRASHRLTWESSRPDTLSPDDGRQPVRSNLRDPLRIVVVYPDLLGTYGDTGNGIVLYNRARWRGLPAELILANADTDIPLSGDIYVIGGGEDGPQMRAANQLIASGFSRVVPRDAVIFGVCAGYQILGSFFPGADGAVHEGLGILDVETLRTGAKRAVGELLGEPTIASWADRVGFLTGFENHASSTFVGAEATPLMRVLSGVGNGFKGADGAVQGQILGSYLHGPALSRNPALADLLLEMAVGIELDPLDDEEEFALRAERLRAFGHSWSKRSTNGSSKRRAKEKSGELPL